MLSIELETRSRTVRCSAAGLNVLGAAPRRRSIAETGVSMFIGVSSSSPRTPDSIIRSVSERPSDTSSGLSDSSCSLAKPASRCSAVSGSNGAVLRRSFKETRFVPTTAAVTLPSFFGIAEAAAGLRSGVNWNPGNKDCPSIWTSYPSIARSAKISKSPALAAASGAMNEAPVRGSWRN